MFDLNEFMDRLMLPNVDLQQNPNSFRKSITDEEDLNRKRRNADLEDMDSLSDTKKIRPLKLISKFKFPRTAHLNFHPQVINMHKHQHTSDSMDNDNQDAVFLPSSFKESVLPYNNNKLKTTTMEPPKVKVITQPVITQHFVQPFFLPPIIDDVVQYRM
ncbi:uncharacterized protein LOC123293972 [Chrysoperla carnea]|uniref:uncharacterized protein LOC123293972 n=1 Tax=Chrysoperla carnea TaxID=189513 RepID=UPI001D0850C2|nr:uncharacterized protein LOC123293972 [Chrysoperla carnea]